MVTDESARQTNLQPKEVLEEAGIPAVDSADYRKTQREERLCSSRLIPAQIEKNDAKERARLSQWSKQLAAPAPEDKEGRLAVCSRILLHLPNSANSENCLSALVPSFEP